MDKRHNFIPRNEGFVCEACKHATPPATGTFRNHCPQCLTSKHVDEAVPGDRASGCGGLMVSIRIEGSDPDCLDLVQQCQRCGHERKNRASRDDNRSIMLELSHFANFEAWPSTETKRTKRYGE